MRKSMAPGDRRFCHVSKCVHCFLIKKTIFYIRYVIRKPESYRWLHAEKRRKQMDRLKRKKWNARELFFMIKEELEKEGLIPDDILDYSSAGSASELILAEEFDVVPHIVHGACEGIYMDIRLEAGECARVFSTPKPELRLGTFKTLQTDKEAYKKMAMLGAEFVYALLEYIDKHKDEFNWTGFDITAFRNAGDIIGKMWTPSYKRALEHARKLTSRPGVAAYVVIRNNETEKEEVIRRNEMTA